MRFPAAVCLIVGIAASNPAAADLVQLAPEAKPTPIYPGSGIMRYGAVREYDVSPDGSYAIFSGDLEVFGNRDLYVQLLKAPVAPGALLPRDDGGESVSAFSIGPSGFVYSTSGDLDRLYRSVMASGSSATQIATGVEIASLSSSIVHVGATVFFDGRVDGVRGLYGVASDDSLSRIDDPAAPLARTYMLQAGHRATYVSQPPVLSIAGGRVLSAGRAQDGKYYWYAADDAGVAAAERVSGASFLVGASRGSWPVIAPDGSFVVGALEGQGLAMLSLDGGAIHAISGYSGTTPAPIPRAIVTPDSNRILVNVHDSEGEFRIGMVHRSNPEMLTYISAPGVGLDYPDQVAFDPSSSYAVLGITTGSTGQSELFRLDLDGTMGLTQISAPTQPGGAINGDYRVSTDGSRAVYQRLNGQFYFDGLLSSSVAVPGDHDVLIDPALVGTGQLRFEFTLDEQWVVAGIDLNRDGRFEDLMAVSVLGGSPLDLLGDGFDAQVQSFKVFDGGVVFLDARGRLYRATIPEPALGVVALATALVFVRRRR